MGDSPRCVALIFLLPLLLSCHLQDRFVCIDPLARFEDRLEPNVAGALFEGCPVCPFTERARYPAHADYAQCVAVVVMEAVESGDLSFFPALRLFLAALFSGIARGEPAETLLPGPGENGFDPWLAHLGRQYDRQFFSFNAAPFGMSLDVHVDLADTNAADAIEAFLADPQAGIGPEAFFAFSGREVFDVVEHYGEVGDLGMFGGMAAAGDAYRYAVFRRYCHERRPGRHGRGRPFCRRADRARERVLDLLEALHVAHAIVGEEGIVVRGLFLRGIPQRGGDPAEIPLFDVLGNPNPRCGLKPQNPTFAGFDQNLRFRPDATRTDPDDPASGEFPDWIFMDNASKDQLTGWVYAMGALYDVIRDDPDIPEALKDRLATDAATMGRRLMRPGPPLNLDMTILDADGCATTFHDLNTEEIEGVPIAFLTGLIAATDAPPGTIPPDVKADVLAYKNAFNGLLGLAALRTFCHISRAPDVCAFYYDDLVETRRWPEILLQNDIPFDALPPVAIQLLADLGLPVTATAIPSLGVDFNHGTNYSGVNMAFMGIYGLLRYEPEADLRAIYAEALERTLWDTGLNPRQPRVLRQSFFDFIYAGLRDGETDHPTVVGGAETLAQFTAPPYWNDAVENCDVDETDAGTCSAIDGSSITLAPVLGRNGRRVAEDPLPKSIRPPSNFEWRSDPHAVNGGGGDRLNPGGDFRGAYWLGRFLERGDEGRINLAPGARGRAD